MKDEKLKKVIRLEGESGFKVVEEKKPQFIKATEKRMSFVTASEMGFSIALPIVLGTFFGLWLDGKFNTHPKLTLSFLFIGIFFGFTNLYLIVRTYSNKK